MYIHRDPRGFIHGDLYLSLKKMLTFKCETFPESKMHHLPGTAKSPIHKEEFTNSINAYLCKKTCNMIIGGQNDACYLYIEISI